MKIDISAIGSDFDGFNSIAEVASNTKNLFGDSVKLGFSLCEFFAANMVAPLYSVVTNLRND